MTADDVAMLSVEQAAERLGTPVRFVRHLIAERRIAFHKIGRYVRIASHDLDAFIQAGRVEAHADSSCERTVGHPSGRPPPVAGVVKP